MRAVCLFSFFLVCFYVGKSVLSTPCPDPVVCLHCKKWFAIFPSPAGTTMVSDIPAGDGKIGILFDSVGSTVCLPFFTCVTVYRVVVTSTWVLLELTSHQPLIISLAEHSKPLETITSSHQKPSRRLSWLSWLSYALLTVILSLRLAFCSFPHRWHSALHYYKRLMIFLSPVTSGWGRENR
jgi:hypothetical protein